MTGSCYPFVCDRPIQLRIYHELFRKASTLTWHSVCRSVRHRFTYKCRCRDGYAEIPGALRMTTMPDLIRMPGDIDIGAKFSSDGAQRFVPVSCAMRFV
jgi:hypothetical protein